MSPYIPGALMLAFLAAACDQGPAPPSSAVPPDGPLPLPPPAAAPTEPPPDAATTHSGAVPSAPDPRCVRPPAVAAATLAAEWPARIGQRVLLRVSVTRALGPTEWLATAGAGERFLVLAPPTAKLVGLHAFVVSGSANAALGGRVRLPELILDDDCAS
jgi:hypothetical protein